MPNGNPVVMHLSCNFVHNVFQCRDTRGVFSCAWDGLQLAYFTYYYLEGVVFIVSRLPPAVDLHAEKETRERDIQLARLSYGYRRTSGQSYLT